MIVGARNQPAMLWLTERVTRFSIPVTMPDGYTAAATLAGLVVARQLDGTFWGVSRQVDGTGVSPGR